MSIAGGLSAQFGMVDEGTFGTFVTPTRFLEMLPENVQQNIERIESKGMRVNRRVLGSDDWLPGRVGSNGKIGFEVQNKGYGLLLKHMMGAIASSQPSAGPDPTVWEHKATVGVLDGKSFGFQFGRTGVDLTTRAFSYNGAKVAGFELSCEVGGILTLTIDADAAIESTAQTLATASYATTPLVPLVYTGGAITIGGVATDVKKFDLKVNNNLRIDRQFIRATTPQVKKEQLEGSGLREMTGSLDVEFTDLTPYNRFVNGTVGSMTAFFTGAIISNAFRFALELTMAAVRFDGDTPVVGGPDIIMHSLPFKVVDSAVTDGPLAMVYRTTDATP